MIHRAVPNRATGGRVLPYEPDGCPLEALRLLTVLEYAMILSTDPTWRIPRQMDRGRYRAAVALLRDEMRLEWRGRSFTDRRFETSVPAVVVVVAQEVA